MSPVEERLQQNLALVRQRIDSACRRAARDPALVGLVAVTKYAHVDWIASLARLGVHTFGENRPQQLVERAALWPGDDWHLIGQLQRNKVRSVLPHNPLIQSVDSLRLLRRISDVSGELQRRTRVLLQVNVSGEASKQGISPVELLQTWPLFESTPNVIIMGLMTMAPLAEDPEDARPTFRGLRELRDELRALPGEPRLPPILSMGMSHDMEVAIEEGATLVRIGSALFDGLS
ncbi:MAG: YggS family pyridoxal phosphate-dependent enzyme [Planctomycetaceae bacterium]|nr:YggS family pyridoxal phosphate-dependent enzyme [Planctomycetaceae bacterium]